MDDSLTAVMCRLAKNHAPVIVTRRGRSELVELVYWPGTKDQRRSGGRAKVKDRAGRIYNVALETVRVPKGDQT